MSTVYDLELRDNTADVRASAMNSSVFACFSLMRFLLLLAGHSCGAQRQFESDGQHGGCAPPMQTSSGERS